MICVICVRNELFYQPENSKYLQVTYKRYSIHNDKTVPISLWIEYLKRDISNRTEYSSGFLPNNISKIKKIYTEVAQYLKKELFYELQLQLHLTWFPM